MNFSGKRQNNKIKYRDVKKPVHEDEKLLGIGCY